MGRFYYHALPTMARATEKLAALNVWGSLENVSWQELTPDAKGNWLTEGMQADFDAFLPLGTKDAKAAKGDANSIFRVYGRRLLTCRDSVVYDFHSTVLSNRVKQFINEYNLEVDRWIRAGRPSDVDNFVSYERLNWSRDLKADLKRGRFAEFTVQRVRTALYRPFCKQILFFDAVLCQDIYPHPIIVPTPANEQENVVICITDMGSEKPFMVIATNHIADLHIVGAGASAQCFPFYVYDEDGTNRRENITDWALEQFRQAHGPDVTKWDIFHYVYALLHDPAYRTRYAENLKRELPRIPVAPQVGIEIASPSPPAPLPPSLVPRGEGRDASANDSPSPLRSRFPRGGEGVKHLPPLCHHRRTVDAPPSGLRRGRRISLAMGREP